jgi:hypothetical protein
VPLAKEANVVEAYLLLERADVVDTDPTPITLHAARIVEPWDGRSISWALQPRFEDVRAPSTTVMPTGKTLVRVDVRELVQRWRQHEKTDQGIAVVADNASPTGMAFALSVAEESSTSERSANEAQGGITDPVHTGQERAGPRLELYVK